MQFAMSDAPPKKQETFGEFESIKSFRYYFPHNNCALVLHALSVMKANRIR